MGFNLYILNINIIKNNTLIHSEAVSELLDSGGLGAAFGVQLTVLPLLPHPNSCHHAPLKHFVRPLKLSTRPSTCVNPLHLSSSPFSISRPSRALTQKTATLRPFDPQPKIHLSTSIVPRPVLPHPLFPSSPVFCSPLHSHNLVLESLPSPSIAHSLPSSSSRTSQSSSPRFFSSHLSSANALFGGS